MNLGRIDSFSRLCRFRPAERAGGCRPGYLGAVRGRTASKLTDPELQRQPPRPEPDGAAPSTRRGRSSRWRSPTLKGEEARGHDDPGMMGGNVAPRSSPPGTYFPGTAPTSTSRDYQWNEVADPLLAVGAGARRATSTSRSPSRCTPGNVVYNPAHAESGWSTETPATHIGAEIDPSHLFWQGIDPTEAVEPPRLGLRHQRGREDARMDPAAGSTASWTTPSWLQPWRPGWRWSLPPPLKVAGGKSSCAVGGQAEHGRGEPYCENGGPCDTVVQMMEGGEAAARRWVRRGGPPGGRAVARSARDRAQLTRDASPADRADEGVDA